MAKKFNLKNKNLIWGILAVLAILFFLGPNRQITTPNTVSDGEVQIHDSVSGCEFHQEILEKNMVCATQCVKLTQTMADCIEEPYNVNKYSFVSGDYSCNTLRYALCLG